MFSYIRKLVRGSLLLALVGIASSSYAMDPAAWSFDIRYNIGGVAQPLAAYHHEQCLTEASPVPDIAKPGQSCTTRLHSRFGNTLTWQIDCSSDWEIVQGVGRISFEDGHAGGKVHLQILSPVNAPQQMVLNIEGRAAGRCDVSSVSSVQAEQRSPASSVTQEVADRVPPTSMAGNQQYR